MTGLGTGQGAVSTGHPGGRERGEMRVKWMVGVHLYSVYSAVYTPTVQHPVAGHNPSVTEEPPREWVGVGALWSAVRVSEPCY